MSLRPKINYEIDLNHPLQSTEIVAVQGSDFDIIVRVKRCGVIQTVENVTPKIAIANTGETWVRTYTGTAGGTNDESLTIPIAGTSLDDNGTMNFDIILTDADANNIVHRRGEMLIYDSVPQSVTPPTGNPIDWSTYTSYSNTATDGPVRPDGSTLEVESTNADGSINLGVIDGTYLPASTPVRKYKVESASFTALPEYLHVVVATATATDFTPPVEGRGYTVLVWNGTATVGGTAYATKGTVIERRYHSGSWTQKVYLDQEQVGSAVQTALGLKADDNAVVKLTGDQAIGGIKTFTTALITPLIFSTETSFTIFGNSSAELFDFTTTQNTSRVNLNPFTTGSFSLGTTALRWLSAWITTINTATLKALSTTGLVVQNSAGTEKLKVGASTGADVQVTGDLSVTEKQATVYGLSDSRDATMSGDETLTTASATNQYLDPSDADRNLDLPNASVFIISNVGDGAEIITVRDEANATIDTIDNGVTLRFQWTGSAWRVS
jgi:hypothetical protein